MHVAVKGSNYTFASIEESVLHIYMQQNGAIAFSINYLPVVSQLYHPDLWDSVADSVQKTAVV